MENNVSNYQEYTFPKLLEQYDKVLVPMIQRDYAQGRTDNKATDVRNNLLNDIFDKESVNFDLIFGSKESRIIDGKETSCFIPIDGQQRLTTLFLLYLYEQKKSDPKLDLSKFSYDTRRAASDFCKDITTKEWSVKEGKKVSEVIKDTTWFMNYWEKDPTVEGMLNMLDAIHEKAKEKKAFPCLDKVKFYFFDLQSNGLNENLYLKMNSRGKPLTAFENLKAKIEKVLPDNIQIDAKIFPKNDAAPKNSFKKKWSFFMDRDWTNTFWDKNNPNKCDVNIAKFIVRILSGYLAAFGQETDEKISEKTIAENLKEINKKEKDDKNYTDYIPFEPIEKVLKLEDAFPALAYALTTAPTIEPYWCKDSIKVSDKSEYKLLSVILTCTLFDGDESAMRFAWNMAENYVSEYDNFVTYCKRVGEIYKYMHDNNVDTFYKSLSNTTFNGNISDQLKEEIAKAKQILDGSPRSDGKSWEEVIIAAEKKAFFKGAIRFLFTKENIGDDWNDFDTKWENAVHYNYDDYETLKSFIKQCSTDTELKGIIYDPLYSSWKINLLNTKLIKTTHYFFMEPFNSNNENYLNPLWQRVKDDLVKTKLLNNIKYYDNSVNGCLLREYKNEQLFALFPYKANSERKKYVIANNRNTILSELLRNHSIVCNQKVDNCDFFWGWDIRFTYKNNYFIYYTNCTVCLMNANWKGKKLKDSLKPDTPENNYYVVVEQEDGFIENLDNLINDASQN